MPSEEQDYVTGLSNWRKYSACKDKIKKCLPNEMKWNKCKISQEQTVQERKQISRCKKKSGVQVWKYHNVQANIDSRNSNVFIKFDLLKNVTLLVWFVHLVYQKYDDNKKLWQCCFSHL